MSRAGAAWGAASAALLAAGFVLFRPAPPAGPVPVPPGAVIANDMFNAADPRIGAKIFKTCASCHGAGHELEVNKSGPPLGGIVGAKIASRPGYEYSDGLAALRGRTWTTDELYEWLRDPAGFAPGTKMSFPGLLDPQDRWDLIAYLIQLR